MTPGLQNLIESAKAAYDSMSPGQKAAHDREQRESFVRGMVTPCVHGILDFEQCIDCRAGGATAGAVQPPMLIALISPAMGSGKSTVARYLVARHGFALLKFAGPLKNMTRSLLRDIGNDRATVERMVEGDLKEVQVPGLGCTPRWLMQSLGNEWGRQYIREDLWVRLTAMAVMKRLSSGVSVVIDDMRYRNEYDAIREMGGKIVRIVRPGVERIGDHASEGALDEAAVDGEICNDSSLADLCIRAGELLRR